MAAHRANAHAKTIDRRFGRTEAGTLAQDLVGFGAAFPFFLAHAVAQIFVDPGNQAAAQWNTEVGRLAAAERLLFGQDAAVDFKDG